MQSLQDATISTSAADCARMVLDVVPVVMRPLRQQMRSHRAAGLTIPQFRSLCFVERYNGASLSAVADHLDLSLPTVSRMINGLVERGYLLRKSSEDDRRHVSLSLRDRGKSVMIEARRATQAFLVDKFGGLSSRERSAVITAMRALLDVFGDDLALPEETKIALASTK